MALSSLRKWQELSETTDIIPREKASVLDVVQNYYDEEDDTTKNIALCNIISLMPLHDVDSGPSSYFVFGYEAAIAIALAIDHLNQGNGTLVEEVDGLNQRCSIRFTTKYIDTQFNPGYTLKQINNRVNNDNSTRLPSAVLGAFRSAVSSPSSIVTGLYGFPQISGASTSAALDDKDQYPKFARTIPSDDGVAEAIIEYFDETLGLDHLVVMNINDSFGNSYVRALKNAATKLAPNMTIVQIPIDETADDESIRGAIAFIKASKYNHIFCIVLFSSYDSIMMEASRMGVAGDGEHNWLFSDLFSGVLNDREFEKGSSLQLAYRGTGMLKSSAMVGGKYPAFASSIRALKDNADDFLYLSRIIPDFDQTPYYDSKSFLDPIQFDYAMFFYDAAILLGLAACDAIRRDDLMLTGDDLYNNIVNYPGFQGVSGNVILDPMTGTRMPTSTFYTLTNFVQEERIDPETGNIMVKFNSVLTDQYFNGTWTPIVPYVFNDGTTKPSLGIPAPALDSNPIQSWVRAIACILCASGILLSIGFALWTWYRRSTRIVLASQPFFLYLICGGCFLMATAIIPLQFDKEIADTNGCTIACNATVWLAFIGFAIVFSSIVSKTHRINLLMQNANRYSRIKVTVRDTVIPVVVLVSLNIILLSLMAALHPLTYEIEVVKVDEFGQPEETHGYCAAMNGTLYYLIPLSLLNLSSVIVAIFECWRARNIATEFAESQYIFKALISIVLVVFIGGPILFIAMDNPNAMVFVSSGIIFVAVCAILLLMFVPKIMYHRKLQIEKAKKKNGAGASGRTSRMSSFTNFSSSSRSTEFNLNDNKSQETERIITTKTKKELCEEIRLLKKQLKRAKSERANRLEENESLMKESHSCEGEGDSDGKVGLQMIEESCPTSMQESQDDLPSNHEDIPTSSSDEEKG